MAYDPKVEMPVADGWLCGCCGVWTGTFAACSWCGGRPVALVWDREHEDGGAHQGDDDDDSGQVDPRTLII
jgi:hypothetical protein